VPTSSIDEIDYDALEQMWATLEPAVATAGALQPAGQRFADALYETFADTVALVRVFATVELRQLPAADRDFVDAFATARNARERMDDGTSVLSLMGTRGVEPAWNDRMRSEGHLGVPLVSSDFVDGIPMIARLLREIGFQPHWSATGHKAGLVMKTLANVNGVFFVDDARSARDDLGRRIIPAQDFVERYRVRSVFGFGGSYLSGTTFVTAIVFASRPLLRSQAMIFVPLVGYFKAATTRMVNRGAFFLPSA
jgi:hypothetical protein